MTGKGSPGTMPGDQSVYAGRALLGFIRPSIGGVIAFAADGTSLGPFPNRKAAMAAITASVTAGEGADGN